MSYHAIISLDLQRRITDCSSGAWKLMGDLHEQAIGLLAANVIVTAEDQVIPEPRLEAEIALAAGRVSDERWHLREDARRFGVRTG